MSIVLDASVTVAWCLADEKSTFAAAVLRAGRQEECLAPAVWPVEVANAVLIALRRGRLSQSDHLSFASLLTDIGVRVDSPSLATSLGTVLGLAQDHGLSAYDASYLELATRTGARLATLDARLAAAAAKCGVALFE